MPNSSATVYYIPFTSWKYLKLVGFCNQQSLQVKLLNFRYLLKTHLIPEQITQMKQ